MRRAALLALGSGFLVLVLLTIVVSPQNAFAVVLIGFMMSMHLFGHGDHSLGRHHGDPEKGENDGGK